MILQNAFCKVVHGGYRPILFFLVCFFTVADLGHVESFCVCLALCKVKVRFYRGGSRSRGMIMGWILRYARTKSVFTVAGKCICKMQCVLQSRFHFANSFAKLKCVCKMKCALQGRFHFAYNILLCMAALGHDAHDKL